MFYLISTQYVGPNRREISDATTYEIREQPGRTNMSNEERTDGWLGTTNDWSASAHGEFETREEAVAEIERLSGTDVYAALAEGVVPAFRRDCLGDWPRFATAESVECAARDAEVDGFAADLRGSGITDPDEAQRLYDEFGCEKAFWVSADAPLDVDMDMLDAAVDDCSDDDELETLRATITGEDYSFTESDWDDALERAAARAMAEIEADNPPDDPEPTAFSILAHKIDRQCQKRRDRALPTQQLRDECDAVFRAVNLPAIIINPLAVFLKFNPWIEPFEDRQMRWKKRTIELAPPEINTLPGIDRPVYVEGGMATPWPRGQRTIGQYVPLPNYGWYCGHCGFTANEERLRRNPEFIEGFSRQR